MKTLYAKKRTLLMTIGSACSQVLLMSSLGSQMELFLDMPFVSPYSFAICVIVILALALLSPFLKHSPVRRRIAEVSFVLSLIWVILVLAIKTTTWNTDTIGLLASTLARVLFAILGIQWNLNYTLNQTSDALSILPPMMMLSALLFFLCNLVPQPIATALILLFTLVNALCILLLEYTETSVPSSPYSMEAVCARDTTVPGHDADGKRTRVIFFATRIAWGIYMCFTFAFAAYGPIATPISPVTLLCSSLLLLCLLIYIIKNRSNAPQKEALLLFVPIIISLLACGTFFHGSLNSLSRIFPMLIVVLWFTQLWTQLPTYRILTHMQPWTFGYLEKCASLGIGTLVTALCLQNRVFQQFVQTHSEKIGLIMFVLFLLLFAVFLFSLWIHLHFYYPHVREEILATTQPDEGHRILEKLSETYGLTKRENEVLYFLARGYSRPYVAEALCISGGTVKTHAHHIYQKLDVSTQDELIEKVQQALHPVDHTQ